MNNLLFTKCLNPSIQHLISTEKKINLSDAEITSVHENLSSSTRTLQILLQQIIDSET